MPSTNARGRCPPLSTHRRTFDRRVLGLRRALDRSGNRPRPRRTDARELVLRCPRCEGLSPTSGSSPSADRPGLAPCASASRSITLTARTEHLHRPWPSLSRHGTRFGRVSDETRAGHARARPARPSRKELIFRQEAAHGCST